MEYASGGDLEQLAKTTQKQGTRFPEKQIWKWAYEMLLAIKYLHDNCVIHCDIKASNILLNKKQRIKIGDFGCSRILNPAKMYLKEEVGTTVYQSPEQVNSIGLYDYKIDIWAFGCCIYYITAFKPPFTGSTFANLSYSILNEEPPELPSEYSDELKQFINKALAKSSKDRPTAIELLSQVPFAISNKYTLPKQTLASSTTFMNPTKSAIGRQKSVSKQVTVLETLKVSKDYKKGKFKTPKRPGREDVSYSY